MSENDHHSLEAIEVEHQAHRNFSLTQRLAIFVALVSALTTIMSYHDALIQNKAFLLKNETLIAQTKASGLWAFYQAKSGKENVIEIMKHFSGDKDHPPETYQKMLERYQSEKEQIRLAAQALEKQSRESNLASQRLMNDHQEGKGILLMQIAISLASITVLTRKKWLFAVAIASALSGILLSFYSWII